MILEEPNGKLAPPAIESRPAANLYGIPIEPMPRILGSTEMPHGAAAAAEDRKTRVQTEKGYYILRGYEEGKTDTYVKNYMMLQKAGLPVVPGLRIVQSGDQRLVMIPDVTQNGTEAQVYGKTRMLEYLIHGSKPQVAVSEDVQRSFDASFTNIMDTQQQAVRKAATVVRRKANSNFVKLAEDDPWEMVVKRDGSWSLMIFDPMLFEQSNIFHFRSVQKHNKELTNLGIKTLNNTSTNIKNPPQLFGSFSKR